MAFNFFKKKEVNKVNDTNNEDVTMDYTNQILNNRNNVDINNLNLSSFESNFTENINYQENSTTNEIGLDGSNYLYETLNSDFKTVNNPQSNMANYQNIPEYDNQMNMGEPININNNISDIKNNTDMLINEEYVDNEIINVSNINNYDYNPVIDNIENASNMANDSQDVNTVLSSIYNSSNQSNNTNVILEYNNQMNTDKPFNNNDNINRYNNSSSFNDHIIEEEFSSNKVTPVLKTSIFNEVDEDVAENYDDIEPGYKRCPKCGQKMREDYKQCFVCGTMI